MLHIASYFTVPPMILKTSKTPIKVNEYESTIIFCKFYGYPKPAIQWMKGSYTDNHSLIANTTNIIQNDSIYIVESYIAFVKVTRNNSGTYSCVASSEYGRTGRNVSLEVFCKL